MLLFLIVFASMHHNIIYIIIYCLHTYTHMQCIIYLQTVFLKCIAKAGTFGRGARRACGTRGQTFDCGTMGGLPIEIDPHFRRFLRKSLDISSSPPHLPTHRDTDCIQRSTSSKHLTTDFSGFVWKTQYLFN